MKKSDIDLIGELYLDPKLFFEQGKTNELLNQYFKGLPLDSLVALLQSKNEYILKSAVWITSELSTQACSLLPYVVSLVHHPSPYIRYYTLECILICANDDYAREFIHIIKAITDIDSSVRLLAMALLSNADQLQLERSLNYINDIEDSDLHRIGIIQLSRVGSLSKEEITDMLVSEHSLIQKYGVIIAKKCYDLDESILPIALTSNNHDVSEFADMFVER